MKRIGLVFVLACGHPVKPAECITNAAYCGVLRPYLVATPECPAPKDLSFCDSLPERRKTTSTK